MPSNVTLNAGTGGANLLTKQVSHDGETTQLQGVHLLGVSGTEDSYTVGNINGDAANGLDVDVTRVSGTVTVDGSGVTQPVSGTVTANLSATDNAVLDQIEVNTSYGDNTGGGTETGALRVTLANNSTGLISVDDNGGSLTVDSADLSTLAGAVSGTEMQVDIASPLPAGTNNIGDVDVLSVVPGTGATNLGKAEDAAHTTGDVGVMALGVRTLADGPRSGTDGDYEPLQTDENGFLKVNIKAGAGSGGTASTDDAAFTAGAGSGTPMMGFVTSDAVDSGDVGVVGMDVNRNLRVSIEADNAGIGGGTQYQVDDAAGATDTGTLGLAIRDDTLTTLTPADGDYVGLRVNSQGALHVTGGGGGTEYVVNDAAPTNPTGSASLMERDDALSTLTEVDGDWTNYRSNARGALWVELDPTNTVSIDDGGGAITVDGTVTANAGTGTFTVTDDGSFTLAANTGVDIGDVTINNAAGASAVNIQDGGNSITVDGTITANLSATDNAVLDQIELNTSYGDNTGGGTEAGALRVTLANDSTGLVSVDDNGGSLTVDNVDITTIAGAVSGTEMQVDVVAALPAGTNNIGDVDIASAIPAGANLVGDVGLSGARTSGGTTLYKNIDVDESEDQVKGTAGQLYWIHAINLNAATRYLKIYNATAAAVVVGTTTPDLTFPIPSNGTTGSGFVLAVPNGIAFSTAITIAATTGVADADTGAPGANEVIVNLGYA